MKKGKLCAWAFGMLLLGTSAFAQEEGWSADEGGGGGSGKGLGIGIETVLVAPLPVTGGTYPTLPTGALTIGYDARSFRIDGLLYLLFAEDNATSFALGARGFFVVHRGSKADFSVGGGLALGFIDPENADSDIRVAIELAGQIRAFLTPSVALLATLGLGMSFGDEALVGIGGQLTGSLGIVYYF